MALELHLSARAKLEPFLLLSKGKKGAAAAKLVEDSTSAPGVFVFGELLDSPGMQELRSSEHASYYSLLQLFAYGTFDEYLNAQRNYPTLNDAQKIKLKLLTLVSLSLERRILPYDLLKQRLQISSIRELEDLIIDGIYLDIIRGKLDQKAQQFEVEFAIGRDLEPKKLDTLLSDLNKWSQTTSAVLSTLDSQISSLESQAVAINAHHNEHEKLLNAAVAEVYDKNKETKGRGKSTLATTSQQQHVADDAMDVDDPRSSSTGIGARAARIMKLGGSTASRKRNRM